MKHKILYQTLKDKGNPEYVEENAPFLCNWENTWLGDGYYFWDTFIDNAHWWGQVRHNQSYIICQATCDFDTDNCFDLVGETEHMVEFNDAIDFLKSQNLVNEKTTVSRILSFLKSKTDGFNFQAIRVYGIKSISEYKDEYKKYRHRLIFELLRPQYLDCQPAIQICIFDKNGLNLRDLKIEYPDEYNRDCIS
ncbi:MAG: hypothetical protein JEZ09_20495 [Salinivirgaceae bacterium]|nr:hypothetical protein [Salinivirgaceae bacterium]